MAIFLTTHEYADTRTHKKVVFDNGSEFKQKFAALLKDLDIKPILTSVKNLQANSPVDLVHQLILDMLATKDIDNKVFDYIDPWGETLASIAWVIMVSYHSIIIATLGQAVFVRYMLSNLASVVEWVVVRSDKQHQLEFDNGRENYR